MRTLLLLLLFWTLTNLFWFHIFQMYVFTFPIVQCIFRLSVSPHCINYMNCVLSLSLHPQTTSMGTLLQIRHYHRRSIKVRHGWSTEVWEGKQIVFDCVSVCTWRNCPKRDSPMTIYGLSCTEVLRLNCKIYICPLSLFISARFKVNLQCLPWQTLNQY